MSGRFAVIYNPRSLCNLKADAHYMNMLMAMPGNVLHVSYTNTELQQVINNLAQNPVPCLVIDGGDGTVCRVLSVLYASAWSPENWPLIVVLPSGNTNLIAADVGFKTRGVEAIHLLQERLTAWEAGKAIVSVRRPLLVSYQQRKKRDLLGFFGGLGAFTRSVDIAHKPVVLNHCPHDTAIFVTLLVAISQIISPKQRQAWLDGIQARITIDGRVSFEQEHFLFLFTTLRKLPHGVWPFWCENKGAVKELNYLDVGARPEKVLKACWNLLRGRVPEWLRCSSTYKSGSAEKVTIHTNQAFVLDGEVFSVSEAEDMCLTIGTGPEVSFLRV